MSCLTHPTAPSNDYHNQTPSCTRAQRRYGTVPHSGFGLGFERLILFSTGIDNIREVVPFPRWPGNALY